jgi:hypothetical protein
MEIHLNDMQIFSSKLIKIYCFSITILHLLVLFVVEILGDSKNHVARSVDTLQSILMLI